MTRPRGNIRLTVHAAGFDLVRSGAADFTWRDMLPHVAQQWPTVTPRLVRETLRNMARAGELDKCGRRRTPWAPQPMTAYAPVEQAPTTVSEAVRLPGELMVAVRSWADFV